jgi:hypothetical protein
MPGLLPNVQQAGRAESKPGIVQPVHPDDDVNTYQVYFRNPNGFGLTVFYRNPIPL